MKSLVAIHEGKFLVGDYINRKLGRKFDVWVPSKDCGVDLLVTPIRHEGKPVCLQVKFSRTLTIAVSSLGTGRYWKNSIDEFDSR